MTHIDITNYSPATAEAFDVCLPWTKTDPLWTQMVYYGQQYPLVPPGTCFGQLGLWWLQKCSDTNGPKFGWLVSTSGEFWEVFAVDQSHAKQMT